MPVRALSTVLKSFAVLDAVAASAEPMRLADLARTLGEARAATYQRLVTLIEGGWVEQTDDGRYRLTVKPVHLAEAAMEQANLGTRLADVLQDVVAESGETASLAVLDDHEAVIVRRFEARGVLRADLRVGTRLALSYTATGRVLTAFAEPDQRERLRAGGAALADDALLDRVRRQGHAATDPGGVRAVAAVAAPVMDRHGRCIAALAVSGPSAGFDTQHCAEIATAAAARMTSRINGEER